MEEAPRCEAVSTSISATTPVFVDRLPPRDQGQLLGAGLPAKRSAIQLR
jgi:hypothetical protein